MSTRLVDYFLGRLNGRFGSSADGTLDVDASPNAGGALPKSVSASVVSTVAGGGVQVCCGTSDEGVIHCG